MAGTELLEKMALPSSIGRHFGKQIWGVEWVLYQWIRYVEQRVMDAIADESNERYIIINAPPQTGKSSWVGLLLPFWFTGMFPHKRVMYISYSDDFSVARGKDVKALHERYGRELFGTSIDPNFSAGGEWRLAGHFGGMLSAGIGGLITGKPGDLIIIDDLIKNFQEATSAATKALHINEWDGTIARRIQPGATVVVIATRWVEDDLSGVLQERMKAPDYDGPQWEVLEFPAFAEPPDDVDLTDDERKAWRDILGRLEGEVLDCRFSRIPGRAPESFFEKAKAGMDPFLWSCLYQQHPITREGGMFPKARWKRFNPSEVTPDQMDRLVRVWDLAATEGGGDWTVGTLMGRRGRKFYVFDVQRFRKDAGGVQDEVERVAKLDGFGVPIKIEEEKGGSGKSVTEAFRRLLIGHVVEPAKAEGDKESRATPWSAEQNKGNAFVPEKNSVDWDVDGFIDEHARMMGDGRRPKHDDRIDTAAYCALDLIGVGESEVFIPSQDIPMLSLERMEALFDRSAAFISGDSQLPAALAAIRGY